MAFQVTGKFKHDQLRLSRSRRRRPFNLKLNRNRRCHREWALTWQPARRLALRQSQASRATGLDRSPAPQWPEQPARSRRPANRAKPEWAHPFQAAGPPRHGRRVQGTGQRAPGPDPREKYLWGHCIFVYIYAYFVHIYAYLILHIMAYLSLCVFQHVIHICAYKTHIHAYFENACLCTFCIFCAYLCKCFFLFAYMCIFWFCIFWHIYVLSKLAKA